MDGVYVLLFSRQSMMASELTSLRASGSSKSIGYEGRQPSHSSLDGKNDGGT